LKDSLIKKQQKKFLKTKFSDFLAKTISKKLWPGKILEEKRQKGEQNIHTNYKP
jgi:hypothetical protein